MVKIIAVNAGFEPKMVPIELSIILAPLFWTTQGKL